MNASNKSTGSEDGGPSSCTPTHIFSDNNPSAKTLIKYEIDESLDIKEEIIQDEDIHQGGKHTLHSRKNQSEEKCITTAISSDNNSVAKTLIEYHIDESLDIKDEIVEDPERHQQMRHSLLSGNNQWEEKYTAAEVPSDNNFRAKTLIKYKYEDTLEITEEIIRDQENVEQGPTESYDSDLSTLNRRVADITTVKKPCTSRKKNIPESKSEPKKYNCENCARIYTQKGQFNRHKKFDCAAILPQFRCNFCDKEFRQKSNMNAHIARMHQKINTKASQTRHKCNECSRSYSFLSSLSEHKHAEHAVVKPQFICDYCGFRTKRKQYLSQHLTYSHFQKMHVSITEPRKEYNCEKCARIYTQKSQLNRHKKFECGVIPQFRCHFCDKKFRQKSNMNTHIVRVHQKKNKKASQMRHKCNECSRSYSFLSGLSDHKHAEHAVVKPQFICDYCGFRTKRKRYLLKHFTSLHFQKLHASKTEPRKEYNCEKCARTYILKRSLNVHKKFDCGVMPQFRCEFCGKQFRRKSHMNRHILCVHQKTKSKTTEMRHSCNKCSRSYSFLSALNEHKRVEHTLIKPQFICDYCGLQTKRKKNLYRHITSQHLNL